MKSSLAVVVPVGEESRKDLPGLVAALREQRDIGLEIFVVDSTAAGIAAEGLLEGVCVLREASPSRGLAYLRALDATDAEWIGWADPAGSPVPTRFVRQLAAAHANPHARLVTSDLRVLASESCAERQACVDLGGDRPPALWHAGVLVHRDALASIDRTCFAPTELELYRTLLEAGEVAHVPEPVTDVEAARFDALAGRAREDGDLLDLALSPHKGEPEVTVFLACHERMDVLPRCLEGFARQALPPGMLEIVVCDDGSTDGTLAFLESLELAVPLRFTTGPNAGACAARNRGLHLIRGRLVLFVNDDTVPAPDLVLRHVEAHRALADKRAVVLGTFEQPPDAMELALTRVLENGLYVFGYGDLAPGQDCDGGYFYTCNASLASEAVRELGEFDEDFPWYTEDTEYGIRLEKEGYRVHYRPEARAWHHHVPTFAAMRRRQPAVAQAHVRLYRKHPDRISGGEGVLTAHAIRNSHRPLRRHLPEFERAAETLASLNLARLEAVGERSAQTAQRLEGCLDELFGKINTLWWHAGVEQGFVAEGLRGFADLLAQSPMELSGLDGPFVLLRPCAMNLDRWQAAAEAWLGLAPSAGEEEPTLVLWADEERGLGMEALRRAAERLVRRSHRQGARAPVVLLEDLNDPSRDVRVFAAARGWLATGGTRDDEHRELAAPTSALEIDLIARAHDHPELPWPLMTTAPTRLLAWPHWDSPASLEALIETLSPVAGRSGMSVVLVHVAGVDGDVDRGLATLGAAFSRRHGDHVALDVVLERNVRDERDWARLARVVDASVSVAGDERAARLSALRPPHLTSSDAVLEWCRAEEGAAPIPLTLVRPLEFAHA